MIWFYFLPLPFRIALASLLMLGGALGAVSLIVKAWRHSRTAAHIADVVNESVSLAYAFTACLMGGVYLQSLFDGVLTEDFFEPARVVFPVLLGAGAAVCTVLKKKPTGICMFFSALFMSTYAEQVSGKNFPAAVFISALLLFARNAYSAVTGTAVLRRSISILSIKDAIDTLPTGIMLCETDGRPLLVNAGFKDYAEKIGGSLARGGNAFWKHIYFGTLPEGAERHMLGACPVTVLSDKKAYMASRDILTINGRPYFQTTVTDVTRRWNVNESLKSRREQLSERSRELAELLANVSVVCRDRELIAARGRVHDVLGQRITIFQRYINSGIMPSKQKVSDLVDDLSERMRSESIAPPEKRFADLCETLGSVGVSVVINGKMPREISVAECFFRVIREASTNSVRHGFATTVTVTFDSDGLHDSLTVSDNGTPPEGEVHYRTGINGMRSAVLDAGGIFEVTERPHFTVKATIPTGDYII